MTLPPEATLPHSKSIREKKMPETKQDYEQKYLMFVRQYCTIAIQLQYICIIQI